MTETEVSYGYIKSIPMSQVVANVKVRCQIKDVTDFDAEISMFANEALSSLGSTYSFIKKNCLLDIVGGKAKLPCGFKKILGLIAKAPQPPASQQSNSIFPATYPVFNNAIYLETNFLNNCREELQNQNNLSVFPVLNTIQIVGDYIYFTLPNPYTQAVLSYMGYAVNGEDGVLEIKPDYERCVSEYCRYMLLRSYNQIMEGAPGREREIDRCYETYVLQRAKIISTGFADDYENNKFAFKRLLNSLLSQQNDPNSPNSH